MQKPPWRAASRPATEATGGICPYSRPSGLLGQQAFRHSLPQSRHSTIRALEQAQAMRLYATTDAYVSCLLTRGVNLTCISEQSGVADATLRKHYGKFIHADARDAQELAKIDAPAMPTVQFAPCGRG